MRCSTRIEVISSRVTITSASYKYSVHRSCVLPRVGLAVPWLVVVGVWLFGRILDYVGIGLSGALSLARGHAACTTGSVTACCCYWLLKWLGEATVKGLSYNVAVFGEL